MGYKLYSKKQLDLGLKRFKYYINSINSDMDYKGVMCNSVLFVLNENGKIDFNVLQNTGIIASVKKKYALDDWIDNLEDLTQNAIKEGLNISDLEKIYNDAYGFLFLGE
ncbi:hypothetical protein HYV79_03270 [Candidatus Woesearchaeota archaeon]|nr:hypothetical protein [Candidatus Woesearchaeota archaeon]